MWTTFTFTLLFFLHQLLFSISYWIFIPFRVYCFEIFQILRQTICVAVSLCHGFCYSKQYEETRQQDWKETNKSVVTRVLLECEREYQEHLLLSVMPAYIAAEVLKHNKCKEVDQLLKLQSDHLTAAQFVDRFRKSILITHDVRLKFRNT